MKKFSVFFISCLFVSVSAFAQTKTITGKIIGSDDNSGLPASVQIKGTTRGASANIDGTYSIAVDKGQTLVYSAIGYAVQEVVVGDANLINVTLQIDATQITEAVVTAMGIKKEKKALGYSVQDIKSEELLKNKNTNVLNSLVGKIAGVSVTQSNGSAGAGATMILRGAVSLERDNSPLFVVDGIIYDNSAALSGESGFDGVLATSTTTSNRVMDINPEDIESMSVLKGGAAAALYGSRAATGAVIITTKKGKEGTVSVNFGSKLTVANVNRLPEQQSKYKRGSYDINGNLIEDHNARSSWGTTFGANERIYNNIEDFFETSTVLDNTLSVAGGSANSNFYLSVSDYRQGGIIPTTGFDKTTFRLNAEQKYGKLTVGANVAYSIAKTDKSFTSSGLYGIDNSTGGAMTSVYRWPRNDDMTHWLNADGTQYRQFEDVGVLLASDINNPYWIANKNKITDRTDRFTGSLSLNLDIFDWWNVAYKAGIDHYTTHGSTFTAPGTAIEQAYQKGLKSEQDRTLEYLSSTLITTFNRTFFDDWNLSLMLGHTVEDTRSKINRMRYWGFVTPGLYSVSNTGANDREMGQVNSRHRLVGLFGEFRVDYKNIAYLTVTGRNDWNSTLPKDNYSYFFPSVSGSFVFTEVLPKSSVLSFGKVRASWASVARGTAPYETNTYLNSPYYATNGGQALRNGWDRGNPYLLPEETETWEVGTELRFFNGRLSLDYTYYQSVSENQILTPRLSQATGYILLSVNAGNIQNKGMELQITGTPIKKKDFTWDIGLNISGNRGKLRELIDGVNVLYVTDVQIGNAKAASFNNGIFMGISGSKWTRYEYDASNPNSDKSLDGKLILQNIGRAGDPEVYVPRSDGNTTHKIGNREPKFFGGLNNTFTYKNLSLNVLLDFRVGGDIYNGTDYYMTTHGLSKRTENRDVVTISGLVPDGSQASGYREVTHDITDPYYIRQYWADRYLLESANFMTKTNWLRLRSISLTFTAPSEWLKSISFIKGLSATVSANNLFVITNYKGMDPETSAAGAGIVGSSSVGMDYCGVPATKGMSFGINLKF